MMKPRLTKNLEVASEKFDPASLPNKQVSLAE
jgi:hypothetical protein